MLCLDELRGTYDLRRFHDVTDFQLGPMQAQKKPEALIILDPDLHTSEDGVRLTPDDPPTHRGNYVNPVAMIVAERGIKDNLSGTVRVFALS